MINGAIKESLIISKADNILVSQKTTVTSKKVLNYRVENMLVLDASFGGHVNSNYQQP